MANNLSFSVRLELLAEKFRQQAEGAKASLRGIQFQALAMAGALGAGITSLQGLVATLVSTAREAGRARTILRNVSKDTQEYGQSLRFVAELADKYGTDLIGTTDAFAKFKAAAGSMGVAVAEQERIFSNISKAMSSFGLSGQEASLTMVAITQMMSKGKISSEELRRQLGERMPIAMQAMANAAGVSLSQLDKLLQGGKLRSADILGKFSDELAKLSGETSTDNLEASLGRLKNTFTSLTDELHIYDHFKEAVDKVKELLEYLKGHLSNFYIWAGGLLAFRLWGKFSTAFGEASALLRTAQAKAIADDAEAKRRTQQAAQKAQQALADADARIARAEAALQAGNAPTAKETQRLASATARGDARFASSVANLSKAQADYRQLTALHTAYLRGLEAKELDVAKRLAVAKANLDQAKAAGDKYAQRTAQIAYNRVEAEASRLHAANVYKREQAELNYAFKADELQKKVAASGRALNQALHDKKELLAKAHALNEESRLKRLATLREALDKERAAKTALAPSSVSRSYASQWQANSARQNIQGALAGGLSFNPAAAQEQAAAATISIWTRTATTFRVLWASAVASVRSVMSTLAPLAILTVITAIVTKVVDWYNKQKEINGKMQEYASWEAQVNHSKDEQTSKILLQYDAYKKLEGNIQAQATAQRELEKLLGLQEGALTRIKNKYGEIQTTIQQIIRLKQLESLVGKYEERERADQASFEKALSSWRKENPTQNQLTPSEEAEVKNAAIQAYLKNGQMTLSSRGEDWGAAITGYNKRFGRSLSRNAERFLADNKGDILEIGADQINAVKSGKAAQKLTIQIAEESTKTSAKLEGAGTAFAGSSSAAAPEDEGKKKKAKKSPLQQARQAATRDIEEIKNKHASGLVYKSEEEYRLALDTAAQRHREALASLLGVKSAQDQQFAQLGQYLIADRALIEEKAKSATQLATLREKVRLGIASEDELRSATAERAKTELETALASGKTLDTSDAWVKAKLQEIADTSAIADLQREYAKSTAKLAREHEAGLLTEKEYRQALLDLIQAVRRKAANTDTPTQGEQERKKEFNAKIQQDTQSLAADATPQRQKRDTTFDYKKSELERQKEERDILSDYIDQLEKARKAGLDVADALEKAQKEAKTLDQGLKLTELSDDLKKYQKALSNQTVAGIKTVAQSARNLKSAFDGLKKAFDPEESASAWERFFAVFDSASQGIDTILSLISMMKELKATKQAVQAVEKAMAAEQIAQNAAVMTSEATATTTEVGLSATRTAATVAETKADTVGAAAKVAKAHSALPFIGVAIAGAMIGALIATIASSASKVPKFASGGIVPGGDGSGDRVLARVNPGELILNKAQQGRLANHLTQASSLRVEVEGRIRARDILQLSNVATRHRSR